MPQNLRPLWTVKALDTEERRLQLVAIKSNRENRAPLEGNVITDASGDFAQNSSKAEVSMSMNSEGAQTWKRLTKENIGKSIAIGLDNSVYSFPTVQSEIGGGRSSITGNFDITEAKDLANILKAGKLPAPARIVQEAVVGPSLGKEAIVNGLFSFVIALVLVLLFMGFYYNKAGWVADIALFANVFFIMGILASLGAVPTLPGIAGIVLTIGMSVDANILIFERVREELHAGNSVKQAIKEGFHNAMSSVIDSNITTLLLGIILYVFGTGPIQGFATTLIIGILTSLFSAMDYFIYTINTRLAFINSGISSWVLNLLGQETMVNGDIVYSPVFSISVKRGCDAIEAMALFSAAILAFPNSWKGKLLNLFFGLVLLFTLNIFRIVSLFLTGVYSPKAFDLMHNEVWQALFVFIALGLWLYFIRKSRVAGKNASQ